MHDSVSIDEGASIGPLCTVGPGVIVGLGTKLQAHSVVHSNTILGDGCNIHSFASVGGDPQDLKYAGGATWLLLGEKCTIREHSTLNRGTEIAGGFTTLGNGCLVMSGVHIGHDCRVRRLVLFQRMQMTPCALCVDAGKAPDTTKNHGP